ncbi:MAG: hypothetical protein ACLFP1_06930 [Candidatus Goldiibacteriota bacterium]
MKNKTLVKVIIAVFMSVLIGALIENRTNEEHGCCGMEQSAGAECGDQKSSCEMDPDSCPCREGAPLFAVLSAEKSGIQGFLPEKIPYIKSYSYIYQEDIFHVPVIFFS